MNDPTQAPSWAYLSNSSASMVVTSGYSASHDTERIDDLDAEPSIQILVQPDRSLKVLVGGQSGPVSSGLDPEIDASLLQAIELGWRDVEAGRVGTLDVEMLERE
jgi:hypothetical protein